MAFRVALTSSIIRATATLNRCPSMQLSDVGQVPVGHPAQRRIPARPGRRCRGWRHRRPTARRAAGTSANRRGDRSAQSMSSSGGPAKTTVSRMASTPNCVDLGAQVDPVAQRLAHRLALVDHLTLVQQLPHRFVEVDHAHVVQHLGEEPHVQQVQDRVLDAADVLGRPASSAVRPPGRTGRRCNPASSSGRSTKTSRRRCPWCRCLVCRPTTLRAAHVHPLGRRRQRRVPLGARAVPVR